MSVHLRFRATTSLSVALALCIAAPATHAAVGSWSTTGPYGGNVITLTSYEAAPSTLFSASSGGTFRSVNGGSSWQRIEIGLPPSTYPSDMAVATEAPVLYLASGARVFRSGNAGDLWVPLAGLPADTYVYKIGVRRGASNSVALATNSGIFTSTNGGSSWTGPAAGTGGIYFENIAYAADGTLYSTRPYSDPAIFGGALVVRSLDAGVTWAATPTQPTGFFDAYWLATWPGDSQRLVVSDSYQLALSTDGGATWSLRDAPGGPGCGGVLSLAAHPTNLQGLAAGCRTTGAQITTTLGNAVPTWTNWTTASGLTVNAVDPVQAQAIAFHPAFPAVQSLWLGTTNGGLFRTTNGGTTWTTANNGYQAVNIRALATHPVDTGPGTVVLAGQGDSFTSTRAILKSPDGGTTWEPAIDGLNAEQIRSIAIDPTTVDASPLTAEPFTAYAGGRSERALGPNPKDGGLYKSTDGGSTWTTIDNGIATVNGVRDMGTVRTVALDPRSCATPPASGPCPIGSGPLRTLFAAGSGVAPLISDPTQPYRSARIYKSVDAGANWTASETGLPLGQTLAPNTFAYMGGVNPVVFDPSNTQTIYIGTFISTNTDAEAGPFPTVTNGVFLSTDGGATWSHRSNGLPTLFGPGTSNEDVLAMAINPVNPQILYAATVNLYRYPTNGRVFKSTNGGASWTEASSGIAGQDVRALTIDRNDPTGETIYAGTGGGSANPGGVYRSTNGGATWNSLSIGMPAYSSTSLAMPARSTGAPARIFAGTNAGVWDYTAAPDEDADGAPSAVENSVVGGDGNGDGVPDAQQRGVASVGAPSLRPGEFLEAPAGSSVGSTTWIVPGTCTQLNDVGSYDAALYPPDPIGSAVAHDPWGVVSFALPACTTATVRVKFHGAAFDSQWKWRNYGPRTPGDATSFGWYSFAGARRIDATTWELQIDARRQGNYRDDANNILFIGGPGLLPDLIFDHGLE
ncbi:WD40/YVTN/BNR-like repeat-containing protein [Dokdonella sp. MW10]|uniref:WD40/YVTN/BNR-like repeat-containing protein n=1 Tax=Dokdonella sp. MW10 TaxID=2992926 RepID=UPI003F7E53AA